MQRITVDCISYFINMLSEDFPGGPVVKNSLCNARDTGSIPGGGTKILYATGQKACSPQLESPCTSMKDPACHNRDMAESNKIYK